MVERSKVVIEAKGRLCSSRDFQRLYKYGRCLWGKYLGLRYLQGEDEVTRLGLAPARKIRKAVRRNRLKRQLRVICRKYRGAIRGKYDIVISISPRAVGVDFHELEIDFLYLMQRAGILRGMERDKKS